MKRPDPFADLCRRFAIIGLAAFAVGFAGMLLAAASQGSSISAGDVELAAAMNLAGASGDS